MYFDVFINNQGSIGTACDVVVSISCTDTNTTLVGGGTGSFYPDISPGETLAPTNHLCVQVNENTPIGTPIYFNMELSCTGYFISEETVLLIGYVSIEGDESTLPDHFMLEQNYPNPFNPTTTISYALPEQAGVKLTVFDILGQEVIKLRDETKSPGNYRVQWNGIDDQGNQVSTGVYFCRLEAGSFSQTIKMVLLR
ncbi:MAG: T9SS type A sorting domain-containing protein [Candidatus Marinimicrobia bacterium]|nr:T9SS type A sorting domain-containing protein [Candidatus Neomarinimicrobiota bacterium]